jgi:phosphoribosyl-AMP cyclohydrolase / phosphoribosyl-ATP pyrophosphohydrolase
MRNLENTESVNFDKINGLIPAIIQDASTSKVLMLGYMNAESLQKTITEGRVTFFSRSKQRLWTKGESSGNFLDVKAILLDCDADTLLIKVNPIGPVCHTGDDTCFDEGNMDKGQFVFELMDIIKSRKSADLGKSYTRSLFESGIAKMAQKVGEEAVETVIEAMANNKDKFKEEAADLLFHYLVLIEAMDLNFSDIASVLKNRHKK